MRLFILALLLLVPCAAHAQFGGNALVLPGGCGTVNYSTGSQPLTIDTTGRLCSNVLALPAYTVATLPTCGASNIYTWAAVSDAASPTYNGGLTGGGTGASAHVPVFCNGSAWAAH